MGKLKTMIHFVDKTLALTAVAMLLVRLMGDMQGSNWFVKRYLELKGAMLAEKNYDWFLFAAVAYLAISLIYVILKIVGRQVENEYIRVRTEKGEINFELTAVQDAIARSLRDRPELEDVQVRVTVPGEKRPIQVTSIVRVWDRPNLVDVTERIQNAMQHRFAEILDIQAEVNFNVQVRKLAVRPPDTKLESVGPRPDLKNEEDTHYFGAQYPIGTDDDEDED